MNERIQAIKNQCWVYRHWDKNGERWVDRHVDLDKFAELIVRETFQVLAQAGIEFGDGMEDAVYKYFGVEE